MNFSLSDVRERLSAHYQRYSYADSVDDFPWDKGYRAGYADALERAIELLKRVKSDVRRGQDELEA